MERIRDLLNPNEKVIWKNISLKIKKIKDFYILTNERWIQSSRFPYSDADMYIASLIDIKDDIIIIDLPQVKGIWITSKLRNRVRIGPYLNSYFIDYKYQCAQVLGLKMIKNEAAVLLERFKELIPLGNEFKLDPYNTFYPRIE